MKVQSLLPSLALALSLAVSNAAELGDGVVKGLGPKLSSKANVILSTQSEFADATKRWDERTRFDAEVVVEVATESDIVETIRYANKRKVPFIAVNGGHGSNTALTEFHDGIVISMRLMNKVTLEDASSAYVEGGITNAQLLHTLWDAGRQTVQGLSECTGYLGPALGGGHSVLQGQHGLSVDNILEARVVLADATVVTASKKSHPDLFWALRGAGHNFGIVSQVKIKTFDVDVSKTWYFESMVFTASQLPDLMKEISRLADAQPARLVYAVAIARMAPVDPVNAIIALNIAYDGEAAEAEPYIARFRDLKPTPFQSTTGPYIQLAELFGQRPTDDICQRDGRTRLRFPAYLSQHKDTSAITDVYNTFNTTTAEYPALDKSVVLIEGVPTAAVKAIPLDSTAVALRDHGPISFPIIEYTDRSLDSIAIAFGQQIRTHFKKFLGPSQFHAYVNYANGDEDLEVIYGYEPWRVEKLKALKARYDPRSRFRFYGPIPREVSKDEL